MIGTSADLTCEARGTQDVFMPQVELDFPVTATYNLYRGDPITPSPCRDFRIAVRYLTTLDVDGNRLLSSAIVTGTA